MLTDPMRHRFPGLACRALLFLLLSCLTVQAQSASTAQLNGSVKDQSGAALPGVTVTATQTATGLVRTAVTDDSGSYVLQNLPVGPYRFEATLQGFRTYAQTGIVLEVGANPTLAVTLELGQLEETVSVQLNTPVSALNSPNFGLITSAADPRIIQLALKYTF